MVLQCFQWENLYQCYFFRILWEISSKNAYFTFSISSHLHEFYLFVWNRNLFSKNFSYGSNIGELIKNFLFWCRLAFSLTWNFFTDCFILTEIGITWHFYNGKFFCNFFCQDNRALTVIEKYVTYFFKYPVLSHRFQQLLITKQDRVY